MLFGSQRIFLLRYREYPLGETSSGSASFSSLNTSVAQSHTATSTAVDSYSYWVVVHTHSMLDSR